MSWNFLGKCSRSKTRWFTVAALMLALSTAGGQAFAAQPFLSGDIFEMVVETDVCLRQPLSGGCSTFGSIDAAAPGNANPIRVTLSLIQPNGAPVTGLPRGDFEFEWRFGQPILIPTFASCPICFEDSSTLLVPLPGMYVLYVTPTGIWEDVNVSRLRIDVLPTVSVYKLIKLDLR